MKDLTTKGDKYGYKRASPRKLIFVIVKEPMSKCIEIEDKGEVKIDHFF